MPNIQTKEEKWRQGEWRPNEDKNLHRQLCQQPPNTTTTLELVPANQRFTTAHRQKTRRQGEKALGVCTVCVRIIIHYNKIICITNIQSKREAAEHRTLQWIYLNQLCLTNILFCYFVIIHLKWHAYCMCKNRGW